MSGSNEMETLSHYHNGLYMEIMLNLQNLANYKIFQPTSKT